MAHSGKERILDIMPTDLHQRSPLFIGSTDMVNQALEYLHRFS